MWRSRSAALVSACTALAVSLSVAPATQASPLSTVVDPGGDLAHEYTDVRDTTLVRPTRAQLDAVSEIVSAAPQGARVTYDDRFGTPRTIRPNAGGALTAPSSGKAVDLARQWLADNRAALGLSTADVASLENTRDHVLGTGTHIVGFRQMFNGVQAVHGGSMTVAVRPNGAIESYAGQTVRSVELAGDWGLSAGRALETVAGALAGATGFAARATGSKAGYTAFAKGGFAAESYVKKTVFVTAEGARPAYQVLFVEKLDEAYDVLVDARSGEILRRASLVAHSESEGTVYENFPGDEGAGGSPVIKSFGPNEQSPSGYVDPTGVAGLPGPTTFGNNANTYANWSNFLVPADQGPRPVSPLSHFNYSFSNAWEKQECTATPPSYALDVDPAATNLFYHHNRIHDEFYRLGFTESGDNFQVSNGAAEGGGDPILGLVQAGAVSGGAPLYTGRDNAYMLTLPDGIPPWSGMFLWEPINDAFEGPCRDGDFDAGVIEHEYAHGLSNRYVSEEDNALNTHQSGSMGEGWGDWYALNYLHREGLDTGSVVGEYVTGNDQRGIRNWAYDENPTTFGDIGYDLTGPEVHADGEIWTTILWDYRKALVAAFGEAKGASIAEHTVTDAMPRSPMDPSFLDMRNAIELAIDDRFHDSADYEQIFDIFWTEFAKRGLGTQAQTTGGEDVDPVPAFDHKDQSRNGTLTGKVVNASTGDAVKDAKVIIGEFEGRVSPLRTTSTGGGFSAPVVGGTYPVTIQARGFGSHTFSEVTVTPGQTTSLQFSLAPNLVSEANGARIVSSSAGNASPLLDDTEASAWKTTRRGNVVVDMGRRAKVDAVQVSAYTTSRFEGLKDFTLQLSTDGKVWKNAIVRKGAFGYQTPRPTAPDLHYTSFALADPVQARYVRFYADAPQGETKENVQVAELQVFSGKAKNVTPLPPPPPDEPVTDTGTISAGTPVGDNTDGGVTGVDFANSCVMPPASQGTDGWVTELPDSFGDGVHTVKVSGASAAPWDLDVYFYAADCAVTGSAASSAADESGTIPSGTKYVLSHLWSGANVEVSVLAEDTQ